MQTGGERIGGPQRARYVCGVVLAAVVGSLSALAALGALIEAVGSSAARTRAGDTLGGDIAGTVVGVVIALACFWVAVHLEHQLRRHQAVARAWQTGFSAGAPAMVFPGRRGRAGRRRYSPSVVLVESLVLLGIFAGLVAGAVSSHSDAERSAFVQRHGAVRVGTIVSVNDIFHSTRSGGYYTADVRMSFAPPVDGASTTVAHYPGQIDAPAGTRYRVLVDPRDPGYAEFPGSPASGSWNWAVYALFAALLGVAEVSMLVSLVRYWRHRVSMSGAAAGPGGWPLSSLRGVRAVGTGLPGMAGRAGSRSRAGRRRSSGEPSAAELPELEDWSEQPSGQAGTTS